MRWMLAITVAFVGGAGCGGGDKPAAPGAESVIREWADTLRSGDVDGAARLFALPSVVENGTPAVILRTRAQARSFNAALPCGARVLRTASSAGFTTAVLRLTERPGPGRCGDGTGMTARTTFVVRDGKISEWRRVADAPDSAGPVV